MSTRNQETEGSASTRANRNAFDRFHASDRVPLDLPERARLTCVCMRKTNKKVKLSIESSRSHGTVRCGASQESNCNEIADNDG